MRWSARSTFRCASRRKTCASSSPLLACGPCGYVSHMPEIRAVLFDLDDTLHDDTYAFTTAAEEVAAEVAAEHGIDALALKHAYVAEAEGFWHRLTASELQTKLSHLRATLRSNALRTVGLNDRHLAERSATNYNIYRKKHFALFPGALDLLRELKDAGKKLALLTNGVSETHR